ncbi:MAG TPA: hypothetical protein VIH48_02960 [Candidatus Bathyarchaeia archaeon]
MSKASSNSTKKISSFVFLIVLVTLAVSIAALFFGVYYIDQNTTVAGYLILVGFMAAALSVYVLLQTRKRIMRLKIEAPPIRTTIECRKCGVKNVRDFQRGDYIFKELEPCEKCNDKKLITAIYKEMPQKAKEMLPP